MPRAFRTPESLAAEIPTRNGVKPFLESRGFQVVEDHRQAAGPSQSQTIHAITPAGLPIAMRVKLCWRYRKGKSRAYSAAQLVAKTEPGKGKEGLEGFVSRLRSKGATHLLVVQPDGEQFPEAALIPADAIVPIWTAQSDESDRLIQFNPSGSRQENHAANGSSPTLYLRDEKEPSVPAQLWNYPGVTNLNDPKVRYSVPIKDTFNDLAGLDLTLLGSDQVERILKMVSGVPRSPAVRRAVLKRCKGSCERPGCGEKRDYEGFLDVHHILGVEKSDRAWTCVALCPNCHREAHFSPEREELNHSLLLFAQKFAPSAIPGVE